MRVAIDATPLTLASGGLARYTQQVAVALAEEFPEDQYVLVSDQRFAPPRPSPANLAPADGPSVFWQRRWWSAGLPWRLSRLAVDLFHGSDFAVPYLPLRPSVLMLHDLSPWMDPAWHCGAERVRRRAPALMRLGLATMILTSTEAVRRQALERFRLHPERVVAVPLAAAVFPAGPAAVAGPEPFFLFVGTLEPRKNIPELLAAWRLVRQQHPADLVLAGRLRQDFPALAPEPGLHVLGELPDAALPDLYARAAALVYPSRYEGFGLPVLEAMQSGACVIASPDPAIAEVAGEAVLRAQGTADLARAMTAVLTRPDLACELRERGRRRAAQFSWQRTARETRAVYEEAVRRFYH